jgi:hypothetical protein
MNKSQSSSGAVTRAKNWQMGACQVVGRLGETFTSFHFDNGLTGRYCGSDWSAASACSQPCPVGLDSRCTSGETFFGEKACGDEGGSSSSSEHVTEDAAVGGYCGSDWCTASV